MRRWTVLVALLAFAACTKEGARPQPPEVAIEEEPPEDDGDSWGGDYLRRGWLARGEPDAPALHFRLRDGGRLQMKVGEAWRDATLDDCSSFLSTARDRHALEMRAIGKPEFEEPDPYGKGTGLFLSIEADPTVPWQHVQWLLTLAAETKYYKLQLSDGARKMLAFIPLDAAIEWIPEQLPPYVVLQIDVIARAGVRADWDGAEVLRPTTVAYRASATRYRAFKPEGEVVARLETGNVREAGPWIGRAREAAKATTGAKVAGLLGAGNTVPFARVFDVMETFVSVGFPDLNLLGRCVPPRAVRVASRLPYPARNYDTAD